MHIVVKNDGTLALTAEMLAHLGVKPGETLQVHLLAERGLMLSPAAEHQAPGKRLLKDMLTRTGDLLSDKQKGP